MLECDGLNFTTEKCMAFFRPIERGVQLRDNGLGLIGSNDHFHADFLVSHRNTSASDLMLTGREERPQSRVLRKSGFRGNQRQSFRKPRF